MILMGLLMFTGKMNDITGYLSSVSQSSTGTDADDSDSGKEDPADGEGSGDARDSGSEDDGAEDDGSPEGGSSAQDGGDTADSDDGTDADQTVRAYEFEMEDQFGNVHRLDDYKGKVIFLNFWATWCGPCRNEMPEIQKLYEEYAAQGENAEVAVIGVAGPGMGGEGSREEITAFMEENGYTYPVLMDETGEMFSYYGISAFPTTFMIDREGNVYGYVSGQLTEDIMRSIIDQTLEGGA